MPPEVLHDETGVQAPSDFNLKPPPSSSAQLSASASASGFSENAKSSGAAMLGDPRKRLHVLLREKLEDSGFSSGQTPQVQAQPLQQDVLHIPCRKPASIACPKSSRFHQMVTESHGVVDGDSESATDDPSTVTADTTFVPEHQQLASLHSRLPRINSLDVATPYNSLEYFDWENQQQDNVLGSPYTPFVSSAEQYLGGHVSTHTFLYSGTSLLWMLLGPAE